MASRPEICYLRSLANPDVKLLLPHNKTINVGRNLFSKIMHKKVSRRQLMLRANYDKRDVKAVATGVNYSGCNGYVLHRQRSYRFVHGETVEVLLGTISYQLLFDPPTEEEIEAMHKHPKRPKLYYPIFQRKKPQSPKLKEKIVGNWELIDKDLLVYTPSTCNDSAIIAGFDLDGTLITTRSGQRFPRDHTDWVIIYPNVSTKLIEFAENGYRLVIFTNQLKLGQERQTIPQFKEKIELIVNTLKVPIQVFASLARGIYRKPAPGMWDSLKKYVGDINLEYCIYVGDAAGREKNWAPHKSKDHSLADRLFALNIGVRFFTPEEFFLGKRSVRYVMPEFDPKTLTTVDNSVQLLGKQEVILMVGSPASGKSYFCKQNIIPYGYVHINRDTLGSKQRCIKAMEDALRDVKSVVIDNTNPDVTSRRAFIEIARKFNIPCRCLYMDVTLKHSKHNNAFRLITDKNHAVITDIIMNSFHKNFQEPTVNEGFSEVIKVKFSPKFDDSEKERLYKMYLLES